MIKAALLHNIQTRPDVLAGTRKFFPLPGERKPLPTFPGIVGNTQYHPARCMAIGCEKKEKEGDFRRGLFPVANPAAQFFQQKLGMVRMKEPMMPTAGVSEPNMNNISSP